MKCEQAHARNRVGHPADPAAVAIDARGLSLRYPDGTTALLPVELRLPVGSLTFLTGASGSGKTSLLRLFMGIVRPTEGALHVLGQDMNCAGHAEIRQLRQSLGPVFQEFRLVPGRTALENVMAGSRFLPSCSGQLRQESLEALSRVGLAAKAHAHVERLSWGERQRVAIARAVARKPALVLADEPTGNLDKENALHILSLLASFRDSQTTVVITTHATHLIAPVHPDCVVRLDAGVMVASQMLDRPGPACADKEERHATTP